MKAVLLTSAAFVGAAVATLLGVGLPVAIFNIFFHVERDGPLRDLQQNTIYFLCALAIGMGILVARLVYKRFRQTPDGAGPAR